LNPFNFLRFLITGSSKNKADFESEKYKEGGKDFVRMVKAKEDSLNSMGEEASLPFFEAGLLLTTSSDDRSRTKSNLDIIVSAFNIYGDEYGNELRPNNEKHDVFGFFYRPLWKLAAQWKMTHLFFKRNMFGVNELSSIFHFPDISYNRAPIISRMQYKILPAPENLPILQEPNGFVMSGKLAENYKNGDLREILKEYPTHRAVAPKQ
jgi:hypothetical protein